jgi:hypothetical protein
VKGFVQPKTAWGEPDLQAVWTSDAALGIPRERPEKFGVRAMLTDDEFAETQKADEKRRKGGENTLVIETTNVTDRTSIGGGNGNGPATYTQPFTLSLPLSSPPGYELLPYECTRATTCCRTR